jgi:O-antigen ligase
MFLWAVLSLEVQAINPWVGYRLLGTYWAALLSYHIARAQVRTRGADVLLVVIGVTTCVAAIAILLEYVGLASSLSLEHRAPSGMFGNRNQAGHFIALGLVATLALALRACSPHRHVLRYRLLAWLALLGAGLAGAAIIVTRTRAAWLSVLIELATLVAILVAARITRGRAPAATRAVPDGLFRRRAGRWGMALFAGAGIGAFLPTPFTWNVASPIADSAGNLANFTTGSGHGRVVQYATTLRIIARHPLLGVGPGNWAVEYAHYADPGDPSLDPYPALTPTDRFPLSDWLGMAAECGLPVLGMLAAAMVALVRVGWRQVRAPVDETDLPHGIALLVLIPAVFTVGALDAVLQNAAPAVLAAVLLAILPRRHGFAVFRLSSPRLRHGMATLLLVPSAAFAWLSARHLRAVRLYGTLDTVETLELALRVDPTDYQAQARLAGLYAAAGNCDAAAAHIAAARMQQPHAPMLPRLRATCSGATHAIPPTVAAR